MQRPYSLQNARSHQKLKTSKTLELFVHCKKHHIFEKRDNFKNRSSCNGFSACNAYSFCKMLTLGEMLKMQKISKKPFYKH